MFSSLDELLAKVYPTKRWGERDDLFGFEQGFDENDAAMMAAELSQELKAVTVHRSGDDDEYCEYIDVLCFGREPSILQCRDQNVPVPSEFREVDNIDELYLRVCLSHLGRVAAVQQVAVSMSWQEDRWVIIEQSRAGVYDTPLLPRMQKLVARLVERDILHLDFGEIAEPPRGFDGQHYKDQFGIDPDIVSYLFYPKPSRGQSTSVL